MRRVGGWATRSVAINSLPFSYISFHSDVNGVLGLPWIAWQLHVERGTQRKSGFPSSGGLAGGNWCKAAGSIERGSVAASLLLSLLPLPSCGTDG